MSHPRKGDAGYGVGPPMPEWHGIDGLEWACIAVMSPLVILLLAAWLFDRRRSGR